jgi:quercetin dioxygenase-like cupin family protein
MTKTALEPVNARTVWSDEDVFIDPTSQVRVVAQAQADTATHRHRFTEVVFVTDGTAIHAVGATERRLATGDHFVMEGEWRHAYRKTRGLKLINVLIRNG